MADRTYCQSYTNRIGGMGGSSNSPFKAQDDHVMAPEVSESSVAQSPHPEGKAPGQPSGGKGQ